MTISRTRATPLVALTACALLSSSALADITLSARVWNGDTWTDFLGTDGAFISPIEFGIFASFTDADAVVSAIFNVEGIESRPLDAPDRSLAFTGPGLGRQEPFTLGSNPLADYYTPGRWRIDAADDAADSPAAGITALQPFELPNHDNPVLLFRFNYIPAPDLTDLGLTVRPSDALLVLGLPGGGFTAPTAPLIESALVIFVPAPIAVAALPLFPLICSRTRRPL